VLRNPIRTALVSLAAALTVVTAASAITGSTPDGEAHPYVGALVVDGSVACSGVLIAATVFATAGHCGADGIRVEVTLNSKLDDGWTLAKGTLEVDASRRSDLAVVILDAAAGVTPATLPTADSVALLKRKDVVTSVGYGYSSHAADGSWVYDGLRRVADSPVVDVTKKMLKISTKQAGPCMGDSGGPQLADSTVLSLTSGGPKDCTGRTEGYRLDTASARSFLAQYVAVP
jgi:V8-like Glu-specific endopeptidase